MDRSRPPQLRQTTRACKEYRTSHPSLHVHATRCLLGSVRVRGFVRYVSDDSEGGSSPSCSVPTSIKSTCKLFLFPLIVESLYVPSPRGVFRDRKVKKEILYSVLLIVRRDRPFAPTLSIHALSPVLGAGYVGSSV